MTRPGSPYGAVHNSKEAIRRMAPLSRKVEFLNGWIRGRGRRSEAATGPNQPDDQQKDDGADRGIHDFRHEAGAETNAELRKQEARDQSAEDADDDIAEDAEAGATDDLTGKPARNQADEQNDQQAFVGQIHETPPGHARRTGAASESLTIIVQCDEALRPGRTRRRGL